MKKTLILGDIHGRPIWKEIVAKEQPDQTIFLGDFVTTHELITGQQQLDQMLDILEYVEADPDNRKICRGNHDTQALGYYWASCFPYVPKEVEKWFSIPENKERFLKDSQWLVELDLGNRKAICSHAGISRKWLSDILKMEYNADAINALEPSEKFGFNGDRYDNYGTSPEQSCTWIRPQTLQKYALQGYDMIVGHTGTYENCKSLPIFAEDGSDISEYKIYLCDALQQGSYLTIEDNIYKIKNINDK